MLFFAIQRDSQFLGAAKAAITAERSGADCADESTTPKHGNFSQTLVWRENQPLFLDTNSPVEA
jgi:hypothetical protein